MYSKQLRKTLSMVMVIAMIMSVCAVCFGTFGNAATLTEESFGGKTYALDFADSSTYDSTAGGNLITMNTTQNTASVVVDGTRVLNKGYYGDPGAYMFDLIDKDANLGSTDGHIVIEPGKKYNINIKVGRYADATHPNATGGLYLSLAFVDASGKVFLATPVRADLATPSYNHDETWMKFGEGASSGLYSLVATIDGDAVQQTVGKAYANCKLAVLCDVQPSKSGTVIVKSGTISITPDGYEQRTINFIKDSDKSTTYPESSSASIGQGQKPVNTNDLIKINSGNGGTGIHRNDDIMRYCFTGNLAPSKFVTIGGVSLPVPDANVVTYQANTGVNAKKYDYFKVADLDYASADNTNGIVKIEAGKDYKVSMKLRLIGHTKEDSSKLYWIAFGLYNPETGAVYALPYDESTLEGLGNESVMIHNPAVLKNGEAQMWQPATITAMIDSSKVGPDGQTYAGCQLVVLGGSTADNNVGVNYKVQSAEVVTINGDSAFADGFNEYDYKPGQPTAKYDYNSDVNGTKHLYNGIYTHPYIYYDANGAVPHGLLIFDPSYTSIANSDLVDGVYVPNAEYLGDYGHVAINDPDISSDRHGELIVEYGKNYSINFEFYPSQYRDNKSTTANYAADNANVKNRWVSVGLQDMATGDIFWVEDATYVTFGAGNLSKKYEVSAFIDSTKVDDSGIAYAGCRVVIIAGGQTNISEEATYGLGNMRVYPAKVVVSQNPNVVEEKAAASIRPEIKEGDLDKFGADFEYKGYQSAGIRFSYTVADEKIANATDLGFVVAVEDLLSVDPYSEAWYDDAAVIKSSTFGKKYADDEASDTYMVTITGLTREGYDANLLDYYFFAAFYYVVDGVTTYVPVVIDGSECSSYGTVYDMYVALGEAYDAEVYGDLAWYEY